MTGLPRGTPVAAGLGDTAASFLACGATQPGICVDVAGTASVFATTTQAFAPDAAAGILGLGRSAVRGLWHPYAYINGGGMNIRWFASSIACGLATAQKGSAAAAQAGSGPDYDDLDALVRDLAPLPDDPWFIPHFEGRVMPSQSGMRGAWAGLRWSHGLDRLYRAILEGAAFEYRIYLDAIRRLYPGLCPAEVRMTGGGSRSLAWTRTKADILRLPFRTLLGSTDCPAGGAPMGAAMLAAAASMGASAAEPDPSILPRIATSWVKAGEACLPNPVPAPLYATRYAAYLRLLDALAGFPGVQE
jgi:xylulokinase